MRFHRATRSSANSAVGLIVLFVGALALQGCDRPAKQPPPPPPAVTVAHPLAKNIVEWDEYTGRFAAVDTVEIRPRVGGYIDSIHFKDGQIVKKGALLFVIDPRPFEIAMARAEAMERQTVARLRFARNDLKRAEDLVRKNTLSEQIYDQRLEAMKQAEAALDAAKAEVRAARLDLDFTRIKAPVDGRLGRALVTRGNLVTGGKDNSTLLATLVSIDPIQFYFDADEAAYLNYWRLALSGVRPSSRTVQTPVRLRVIGEKGFPHKGRMDFVDNQVDRNTGTIRGRAIFDNPDQLFIPGMFGRLSLRGRAEYRALLLPDAVIGTDQTEKFVYVLNKDKTVAARHITTGPMVDGLRVIRTGITSDDIVVINGLMRIRPGIPVTPAEGQVTAPDTVPAKAPGQ